MTTTTNPAIAKFIPSTGATQAETALLDQLRLLVASNPRITEGDFETAMINVGATTLNGTTAVMAVIKEVEGLMRAGLGRPALTDFDRYILKAKRVLDTSLLPSLKEVLQAGKKAGTTGEQLAAITAKVGAPTGHEKERPWTAEDMAKIAAEIASPTPDIKAGDGLHFQPVVIETEATTVQEEAKPAAALNDDNVTASFYRWNAHPRTPILSVSEIAEDGSLIKLTDGTINRALAADLFLAEVAAGQLEAYVDGYDVVAAGGTAMLPEEKVPADEAERPVLTGSGMTGDGEVPEEDEGGEVPKTVGTQIKVLVRTKGIGARFFFEGSEWEICQLFDDVTEALVKKKLSGTRAKGTKRLFSMSEVVGTEKPASAKKAKAEEPSIERVSGGANAAGGTYMAEPQAAAEIRDLKSLMGSGSSAILEAQSAVLDAFDRMFALVNEDKEARADFLANYDAAETFVHLFKPVRDSLK